MKSHLALEEKLLRHNFCAQTTSVCARPFQRETCGGRLPTRPQVSARQGDITSLYPIITHNFIDSARINKLNER